VIVARIVAVSLLSVLVYLGACSKMPEPSTEPAPAVSATVAVTTPSAVPQATPAEIKAATGPDICLVQIWAATAFERANNRSDDKALLDRVAWYIAVDRVTKALTADPHADKERVLRQVAADLQDVYKTPKLAECKSP
jgi:hypothetical protein